MSELEIGENKSDGYIVSTSSWLRQRDLMVMPLFTTLSPHNSSSLYLKTLHFYDYAVPLVGFVAIILNLAVVISSGLILKKGQQPRSTYILLGNVALSDLMTAASTVFGQLYPKNHRDHYACSVQIGIIVASNLVSVYSVGLIAIDRFLYILHGLKYQQWIYPSRIRLAIAITWICGLFLGLLPLMGWYGDAYDGRQCWFILLAPKELLLLIVSVGALPLLVVTILYATILRKALRNLKQMEATTEINEKNLRKFIGTLDSNQISSTYKKWRAIKVVFFTATAFLLTWGPYFIACTIYVLTTDEEVAQTLSVLIASPLAILGFVNVLIDPLIYAWWHKGFRKFVFNKYDSIRRRKISGISSFMSSSNSLSSVEKDNRVERRTTV